MNFEGARTASAPLRTAWLSAAVARALWKIK